MTTRHPNGWGIALLLVLSATAAYGQTLGEVARQEEVRRKAVKAPSRVYTNADLPSAPQTPATGGAPVSPTPSEADGASKTATTKPKPEAAATPTAEPEPVKDEAYWRDRITTARTDIERTRTYMEALQSRINALTTDFVNRDDPAQRAVIASDRNRAISELERLKGVLQEQTKTVAAVEEEARHAGVPPGWLR